MKLDLKTLQKELRFNSPEGWDWSFRTFGTMKIRYGQIRSRHPYDAVAVIIGGLGDFGEQYFELTHELTAQNIKTIIIDMPGQGGSSRYIPTEPMKRHSEGFDITLTQLHELIDEVVLSAAIDIDDNHKRLPCILIAHSMGGHIALRYLAEYNKSSRGTNIFNAAIMTAPMLGIQAVNRVSRFLRYPILKLLSFVPTRFVPGGSHWFDGYRERHRLNGIFSSDPTRYEVQRAYFNDPDHQFLVIGSPTNQWLFDAYQSCKKIEKAGYLEKITIPVLIGLATEDRLVDNQAITRNAKRLVKGEVIEILGAQHEIFMESDKYRTPFVERFFTFITENVLNGPNKGKTFIQ